MNSLFIKIIFKDLKKQSALSAPFDPGDDLNPTVPLLPDKFLKVSFSFNHAITPFGS